MSLPLVKLAAHVISTAGVTKVVGDIVRNNTTIVTTVDAVRVQVGSLVIGSLVVQQTSKHVAEQLDALVAWYNNRNKDETDLKIVN